MNRPAGVARITISLPTDLLEAVERWQRERGETRSAIIREALERVLQEEQEREEVERWTRSYRAQPQTEDESGWADLIAHIPASEVPWQ